MLAVAKSAVYYATLAVLFCSDIDVIISNDYF